MTEHDPGAGPGADLDLLAEALPRYEIGDELGRGGWGVVYAGRHRELGRAVAIKQLARQIGRDATDRQRFVAEARLVAGLQHPHIVPVYDFVERPGVCAIVMELATGGSLRNRIETDGLSIDAAVAVALATAAGLQHAHGHDLLHRDIKPDNILFSAGGTVKIVDFGIAKVMSTEAVGPTATGTVIGTPAFMAPEQITGGRLSPATDVYALAVVTYQLLAGRLPFDETGDGMAMLYRQVHAPPHPLVEARPDVGERIAEVVHRGLAKDAIERPPSAEHYARDLAVAATERFGRGWLARSGVAVMGSTDVIGATERDSVTGRAATTVASTVHPDDPPGIEVGGVAAAGRPEGPAPIGAGGVGRSERSAPVTSAPGRPGSGRAVVIAAIAVLLAALIGVGVVVAARSGGDETADEEPSAPTGGEGEPITATERMVLRSACLANDVSERRCECAVDRAGTELDPVVFRRNLRFLLENDGELGPEFAEAFQRCVDDGF